MTTDDYLKITGYSKEEWTVLDEATSKLYKNQQGAVNNMYPISDKKFIKALGTGYNLVNLSWRNKHMEEVEIKEIKLAEASNEMVEAKKVVDGIIPSAVPPPPSIPSPPKQPQAPDVSGIEVPEPPLPKPEDDFFCEQLPQTGICCEEQCDDCKTIEHGPGVETEIQKIKEIVEESGVPKENVIIAGVPKPLTKCSAKELLDRIAIAENELSMVQVGDTLINEATNLKWPINSIEVMSIEEFDKAMATNLTIINTRSEDLKKSIKEETVPTAKELAMEKVKQMEAEAVKKELIKKTEKPKVPEPKKETVKETPKENVIKQEVIVGDEKTITDFEFLDRVIHTATSYKKTAYAITLIKNTLKATDLTAEKKIVLIENAVNNIK